MDNETPNPKTGDSKRMFFDVKLEAEHYKAVRAMITEATVAKLKQLSTKRLMETLQRCKGFLQAVTPRTIDGVTHIPVVYFTYTSADRIKGKRWAYRQALKQSIETIQAILTERGNVVSPLVADAETAQAGAAPVTTEQPVAVAAGETASVEDVDDLPL